MVSAMAVGMIACGNQASTEQQDNSQPVNEGGASEESVVAGDTAEVFKNYTDGLKTIGGTTFKMYGNYSEEKGIYATVEAEDGLLYNLINK